MTVSAIVNALWFGIRCEGVGLVGDTSLFSSRWNWWKIRWNIGGFTWRDRRVLPGGRNAILVILLLFHFQGVIKNVLKAKVGGQCLHWI